jgi:hypothetical protein
LASVDSVIIEGLRKGTRPCRRATLDSAGMQEHFDVGCA